MGPRRCRRGRPAGPTMPGRPSGFNGATPMSAWKTGLTGSYLFRAVRLQWGHADVGVEDRAGASDAGLGDAASMGPRRCRRGRPREMSWEGSGPSKLQWGHADVGVEDWSRRRQRRQPCGRLQWGHADVGVEDESLAERAARRAVASMGPRRCRRGRRAAALFSRDARADASMGPRRCRRGRRPTPTSPTRRLSSFNGATPMSAWKTERCTRLGRSGELASMGPRRCRRGRRAHRAGLHPPRIDASMGPRRCRRGRRRRPDFAAGLVLASMGPRRCRRGRRQLPADGAGRQPASMGPRRCRRGRHLARREPDRGQVASMGPRRCRRGRRPCATSMPTPRCGFNGATPMSAWKTYLAGSPLEELAAASMGPRRCRRGRRCASPRALNSPHALQWGHADVGVEDPGPGNRDGRSSRRFNGATPMSAWKTRRRLSACAIAVLLQWGHADVGVEDRPFRGQANAPQEASMGPRRCRRGRRSCRVHAWGAGGSFNGATPMSAWKTSS